jgi:hypothetical protein
MNDEHIKGELQQALMGDGAIKFKRHGNELRDGICPNCGQKELFVRLDQPWRVQCRRFNKCNYSESTRALYPDLFENFSKKYQATEEKPNAAADAYMSINRGFELGRIRGEYEQAYRKLPGGGDMAATVRVRLPLVDGASYWERLIDAEDVRRNGGKKAHISYGCRYQGLGWVPKGLEFSAGAKIWITEGIFKSMALGHVGIKSISALSCSNLPRKIIQEHKGKGIVWVVALDNDEAGISYAAKARQEIREMGETFLAAFPRKGEDWDDVFRAGRLTAAYLQESYWRGWQLIAESAQEKAMLLFLRTKRFHQVFPFGQTLWKYKLSDGASDEMVAVEQWDDPDGFASMLPPFRANCKVERISNCLPEFMYIERDSLTDEQWYSFRFRFASGNPELLASLDGGCLESASAFNKALLTRTPGGTFDGSQQDMKRMRDGWFDRKISYVSTTPFVGYDANSESYVFPGFGYHHGQRLEENKDGYLVSGRRRLKCGLRSTGIVSVTEFRGDWIGDYQAAFGLNGLVLMSWWLGSLFAEQIRKKQKSWPFMEYTGDQGAGKSTQIEFLWRCVGRENYEGFDPSKSTHAGRSRNFQQVANLPVVLLEGDRNSDSGAKRGVFDMDELKTAYNGRGIRAMGVKKRGAETEEPLFRAALLVSQNAQVDGSDALLSRIVYCHCTKAHFTDATEKAARRLSELEVGELAGFMDRALRAEPALLKSYFEIYEKIREDYRSRPQKVQNRLLFNHAQVAAWCWQLTSIFPGLITVETCQAVQNFLWERCLERQQRLQADHPLVEQFWDIVEYLNYARSKDEHGAAVQMLNHSAEPAEIAISLPHMRELSRNFNMDVLPERELKRMLPTSRRHKFVRQGKVRSVIMGKIIHCWIFENKTGGKAPC